MIYEFTDTVSQPIMTDSRIKTVVNGINLDDIYSNKLMTLNVTGRAILPKRVRYTEKDYSDGAWHEGSSYPARSISVEVKIKGDSNEEAREIYNNLNELITQDELSIHFTDEPNMYFNVRLAGVTEPKEDQNELIIELRFIALDPFKYGSLTVLGKQVPSDYLYEITPNRIKMTLNTASQQTKITNPRTGKNIVLEGSYVSGDILTFEWGDSPTIKRNGQVILSDLNILSDFETFTVTGGDTLDVLPSTATFEMTLRRKLI